eukprot:5841133-Pleurochrysis_carterae.AAC.1
MQRTGRRTPSAPAGRRGICATSGVGAGSVVDGGAQPVDLSSGDDESLSDRRRLVVGGRGLE